MKKTLIAGVAALSLALTPAQAQTTDQGFQHEDLATAFFALLALGVIGKALTNNSHDSDPVVAPTRPHRIAPDHEPRRISPDRGGLREDRDPAWWADRHNNNNRNNRVTTERGAVPASCLRDIRTRQGTQRVFGRGCLRNNYAGYRHLPDSCEVRIASLNGIRNGFAPACLRSQGFTIDRRH